MPELHKGRLPPQLHREFVNMFREACAILSIIPIKLTAAVGGFFCSDEAMIIAVMREYSEETRVASRRERCKAEFYEIQGDRCLEKSGGE